MMDIRRIAIPCCVFWLSASMAVSGLTVTLDQLALDAPSGTTNQLNISLQTSIGNDNDVAELTGTMSLTYDFLFVNGPLGPTDITFTGGDVAISDVQFSLFFGVVNISTSGLGGTPSTLDPPSTIIKNSSFLASDHEFTLNRGVIQAPGTTWDLTTMPISAQGTGIGTFQVASLGAGLFEAVVQLPVEFNQPFELTDVPIVGTVTGTIAGSGNLVARQQFQWSIPPGDYDFDTDLDCDDIDILQEAILSGATHLMWDANGDLQVNVQDYYYWVTDLKGTNLGDGNLDFAVDGGDFSIWNASKFTLGHGWCEGDYSGDQAVDGLDFGLWNANKFTSAAQVPEPSGVGFTLVVLVFMYTKVRLTKVHFHS